MQLEDYFNFLTSEDIRLKGSRIGIETILYDYIDRGLSPEEIAQTYPTIALDQVYATILYYLRNQETITAYMVNWLAHGHKMRAQQRLNPPSIRFQKTQEIDSEIKASQEANDSQVFDG